MQFFSYDGGRLHCEGVSLDAIGTSDDGEMLRLQREILERL